MVGLLKAVVLGLGGSQGGLEGRDRLSSKVLWAELLVEGAVGPGWAGPEWGTKATWGSYGNR